MHIQFFQKTKKRKKNYKIRDIDLHRNDIFSLTCIAFIPMRVSSFLLFLFLFLLRAQILLLCIGFTLILCYSRSSYCNTGYSPSTCWWWCSNRTTSTIRKSCRWWTGWRFKSFIFLRLWLLWTLLWLSALPSILRFVTI